jgi:predicted nuclease of predicted toxin-antitoxin system
MKLLFDENLSPKLPKLLATVYPGSMHVRDCGLKGMPDDDVWDFARNNGFTLVSKDSDFYQRSMLYGSPPKLVWLRIGNCTRDHLVTLLTSHAADIHALDASTIEAMIAIS